MKQVLSASILISFLAFPVLVLGVGETPGQEVPEIVTTGAELIAQINNITNWIFVALFAVATIFLIIAGFMFVTAGGNPEQVNKARQMLINALIGVAIALAARGAVAVVSSILGYTPGK